MATAAAVLAPRLDGTRIGDHKRHKLHYFYICQSLVLYDEHTINCYYHFGISNAGKFHLVEMRPMPHYPSSTSKRTGRKLKQELFDYCLILLFIE